MHVPAKAKRIRIYLSERDKVHHQPAHVFLLDFLHRERAHGATLFRGSAGFGTTGAVHVQHLVEVAQDLPLVLEWIDSPEQVDRLLPRIEELMPRALITSDEIEVRRPAPWS